MLDVNPYREADTPERRERRRQVFLVLGVLLVLGGSFVAVTEAFGAEAVCGALGCVDTRDPSEIWAGLVACLVGALLVWRHRSRS